MQNRSVLLNTFFFFLPSYKTGSLCIFEWTENAVPLPPKQRSFNLDPVPVCIARDGHCNVSTFSRKPRPRRFRATGLSPQYIGETNMSFSPLANQSLPILYVGRDRFAVPHSGVRTPTFSRMTRPAAPNILMGKKPFRFSPQNTGP